MKRPLLTTILIASAAVLLPVLIVSSFAGMGVRKAAERRAGSSVVIVHPHEESVEAAASAGRTTVFLAGTIDMGSGEDWQAQADSLFAALPDGDFLLFNPRQEHWDASKPGEMDYQVNWELDHLEKADWIIMNFLPGSRSPITLLELGLHATAPGHLPSRILPLRQRAHHLRQIRRADAGQSGGCGAPHRTERQPARESTFMKERTIPDGNGRNTDIQRPAG